MNDEQPQLFTQTSAPAPSVTSALDMPYSIDDYLATYPEVARVLPRQKLYRAARGSIKGSPPMRVVHVGAKRILFTHRGVLEWFAACTTARAKSKTRRRRARAEGK